MDLGKFARSVCGQDAPKHDASTAMFQGRLKMMLSSRASWPFPVIVLAIGPKKVEFVSSENQTFFQSTQSNVGEPLRRPGAGREHGFFLLDMCPQTMPLECSCDSLSRNRTPSCSWQAFVGANSVNAHPGLNSLDQAPFRGFGKLLWPSYGLLRTLDTAFAFDARDRALRHAMACCNRTR